MTSLENENTNGKEDSNTKYRREFLQAAAIGTATSLSGCLSVFSTDPVNKNPQQIRDGSKRPITDSETQTSTQKSSDALISVTYDEKNEYSDATTQYVYKVKNTSDQLLRFVGTPANGFGPVTFYNISPGGTRQFQMKNDEDIDSPGAMVYDFPSPPVLAGQFRPFVESADVTAEVSVINKNSVLTIPNPTDINPNNVQETKISPLGGEQKTITKRGRFSISFYTPSIETHQNSAEDRAFSVSAGGGWISTWRVKLTGVSGSDSFTLNVPMPKFSVSIDDLSFQNGRVYKPTVSITAKSKQPAMNAHLFTFIQNTQGDGHTTKRLEHELDWTSKDVYATPMIDKPANKRPGTTITERLASRPTWNFPLNEGDKIGALLVARYEGPKGSPGLPIAYTEEPLRKFT